MIEILEGSMTAHTFPNLDPATLYNVKLQSIAGTGLQEVMSDEILLQVATCQFFSFLGFF